MSNLYQDLGSHISDLNSESQDNFRRAMGSFVTGITNVSIYETQRQRPLGLTINSLSSVSLSPPLLLFCLDEKSRVYDAFTKSETFCVNILSEAQKEISIKFSNKTPDPWQDIGFDVVNSDNGQSFVRIHEALVHIDCYKVNQLKQGDHMIIIGQVVRTMFHPNSALKPLTYYRGQYHTF